MSSIATLLDFKRYDITQTTSPSPRDYRIGWLDNHNDQVQIAKTSKSSRLIIGDSIASGLSRYPKVWYKYFAKKSSINFGIPGDHTQHVLWRLANISLPDTLEYAVVQCGTNNVGHDSPRDIADGVLLIGLTLLQKLPKLKIIISGLLPRDHKTSVKRKDIEDVNKILKEKCSGRNNIVFIQHKDDWIDDNGALNNKLFYRDNLHLIEAGNMKLADSINRAINSISNISLTIVKNTSATYKEVVRTKSFTFEENEFPLLTKLMLPPCNKENEKLFSSVLKSRPAINKKSKTKNCENNGHRSFDKLSLPKTSIPASSPENIAPPKLIISPSVPSSSSSSSSSSSTTS